MDGLPTVATFAKGLTEAAVLAGVFVPFAKYILNRLFEQQKEDLRAFREELHAERDGHEKEVAEVLEKYNSLKEITKDEAAATRELITIKTTELGVLSTQRRKT